MVQDTKMAPKLKGGRVTQMIWKEMYI